MRTPPGPNYKVNLCDSPTATAFIGLQGRPMANAKIFQAYLAHLAYFYTERGLLSRLCRGVAYGRPALDIQLIHATSHLAQKRERLEARLIERVVRTLAQAQQRWDMGGEGVAGGIGGAGGKGAREGLGLGLGLGRGDFWRCVAIAREGRDSREFVGAALGDQTQGNQGINQCGESDRERIPPYVSGRCRQLSRGMLLAVLLTLALNLLVSAVGTYVFFTNTVAPLLSSVGVSIGVGASGGMTGVGVGVGAASGVERPASRALSYVPHTPHTPHSHSPDSPHWAHPAGGNATRPPMPPALMSLPFIHS
jgi:hypothetical protein